LGHLLVDDLAMKPLAAAIKILEQARDTLTERLVQRIVESRHDIQDDAEGVTYMSEIEQVFDQIGNRLNHVNALLANLPSPAADEEETDPLEPLSADMFDDSAVLPLALPSPAPPSTSPRLAPPVTLAGFVSQNGERDDETSARMLAEIFDIPMDRARAWSTDFRGRLEMDPQLSARLLDLPSEATNGRLNTALSMLWECFGIQGIEALGALQSLRARFADGAVNPIRG
jgi:hypothetical protein